MNYKWLKVLASECKQKTTTILNFLNMYLNYFALHTPIHDILNRAIRAFKYGNTDI